MWQLSTLQYLSGQGNNSNAIVLPGRHGRTVTMLYSDRSTSFVLGGACDRLVAHTISLQLLLSMSLAVVGFVVLETFSPDSLHGQGGGGPCSRHPAY
jgi:hypothetical protein